MKQQPFEEKHRAMWQAFEQMLTQKRHNPDMPEQYRQICHHLALARSRNYSATLCQKLNKLVMHGHQQLYSSSQLWHQSLAQFLLQDFPSALAENRKFVWVSMALFFLPLLLTAFACSVNDELVLSLYSPAQLSDFEAMYDPEGENQLGAREASDDLLMFGYYIKNNISIGFQTFASGIFAGIGSIFIILFNGLMIGAMAGHMLNIGYTETFFSFVIGHGSFELTAIALAGAAGMRLGFTLINPKGYRRLDAMNIAGKKAIVLVYGVFIMLLIAALLEAFWSSSRTLPSEIKYAVGTFLWLIVLAYLIIFSFARLSHSEEPSGAG